MPAQVLAGIPRGQPEAYAGVQGGRFFGRCTRLRRFPAGGPKGLFRGARQAPLESNGACPNSRKNPARATRGLCRGARQALGKFPRCPPKFSRESREGNQRPMQGCVVGPLVFSTWCQASVIIKYTFPVVIYHILMLFCLMFCLRDVFLSLLSLNWTVSVFPCTMIGILPASGQGHC